jgi:hypothetical protein
MRSTLKLKRFSGQGCFDTKIGKSGIAELNSIQQQTNKINLLQTLAQIINYLELAPTSQDYLVKRFKELALTACISDYHWNSGSSLFKTDKEWSDYLPTDASILMHVFVTYMNSRLLPHPRYPNGKSFQMQYFYKLTQQQQQPATVLTKLEASERNPIKDDKSLFASKPADSSKDQHFLTSHQQQQLQQQQHLSQLYLYEFKSNPPEYKVVCNKEVFDIQPGRNNLFDAIICFLTLAKFNFNSSLGQVKLDSSGVNIIGVLDC